MRTGARASAEALDGLRVLRERGVQELEREQLAGVDVLHGVHGAHAAAAEPRRTRGGQRRASARGGWGRGRPRGVALERLRPGVRTSQRTRPRRRRGLRALSGRRRTLRRGCGGFRRDVGHAGLRKAGRTKRLETFHQPFNRTPWRVRALAPGARHSGSPRVKAPSSARAARRASGEANSTPLAARISGARGMVSTRARA
jgi:hypothetical protein